MTLVPAYRPRPHATVLVTAWDDRAFHRERSLQEFHALPPVSDSVAPVGPFTRISGVFVARKDHFAVEVGFDALSVDIVALAFDHLPLADNGWSRDTATARLVGIRRWEISRT